MRPLMLLSAEMGRRLSGINAGNFLRILALQLRATERKLVRQSPGTFMKIISSSARNISPITSIAFLALFALSEVAALPDDQQKLAEANTDFAFKLVKEISKEQPEKNIFISPYSVSTVLQMVDNGAGGKTKEEIRQALGLAGMSQSAQNEANRALSRDIESQTKKLVLNTANAIWYRNGVSVKPEFIAINKKFYQATVEGLDFDSPATVGIINSWVKEKTRGKIPSMVDGPINPATQLYLANAVYFKGQWETPFELSETKEKEFYLRRTPVKNVPMMFQGGKFSYRRGTGYQAVRLPYEGRNLGMYIFLPDKDSSPEKLLTIMNGVNWQRVTVPGFAEQEGSLTLPRFKFEYGVDLVSPLKAMGIKSAFKLGADFSALSKESVFIGGANQKTFVEVNEKGTEAAAVTAMEFTIGGIEMNKTIPFEMIVDRPFLVVIADGLTQTILFMGIIFDPSGA
jgi:serine protease inhibitor